MTTIRRGVAAMLVAALPLLVACGGSEDEPTSSPTEAAVDEAASDDSAGDDSTGDEPAPDDAEPTTATVRLDDLSADLQALHAEVLLFVPIAEEKAGGESGESMSMGSSFGTFKSPEETGELGIARPEGIRMAENYEISWGDVLEFSLSTDSRERVTWKDGDVSVDIPVDSAQDPALTADVEAVQEAMEAWYAEHDAYPSVEAGHDTYLLRTGLFAEDEEDDVELPRRPGIEMAGFLGVSGAYTVTLASTKTGERAEVTQSGVEFIQSRTVIGD